jgi:uncharacterized paraquat-inducible protein A
MTDNHQDPAVGEQLASAWNEVGDLFVLSIVAGLVATFGMMAVGVPAWAGVIAMGFAVVITLTEGMRMRLEGEL